MNAEAVKQEVERWLAMSADEMRLRAGELTPDEVRLVRAILRAILAKGLDASGGA